MSKEYNKYLQDHKENVSKAYYWLVDNLPSLMVDFDSDDYERQICSSHDQSKSDREEYDAYDEYFYGKDSSFAAKQRFNRAWLNHIHNNLHHWQYWVLINDDPNDGEIIIDMPNKYIIEMICDWWSFSFKQGDLYGIFDWYNEHKKYMKLSVRTKTEVEYILAEIHKQLSKGE